MNRAVRTVGLALTALTIILIGQLTYLQVIHAAKLDNDPRNLRSVLRDINRPRGNIVSAEGEVLASSARVEDGTEFKFQRTYPLGTLTAHVVGYQSFVVGNTGVERTYNDQLSGHDPALQFSDLGKLFSAKDRTGTLVLTLRTAVQRAAAEALGDQRGSVVVLDVKTGGILAMYSNPTYDPQPLASHDTQAVSTAFQALSADPTRPNLFRAAREIYPPGSTFKVVTTAVGLDSGAVTPDTNFPVLTDLTLPLTTNTLKNFGGQACGGTLQQSFVQSCNTTFGALGLQLGDQLTGGIEKFGIGTATPPLDISPGAVRSLGLEGLSFRDNSPLFAFAGIGQGPVAVTPLQMALVAESVATGGTILEPHVGAEIRDVDGRVVKTIQPSRWVTAMSAGTAQTLNALMRSVVERGTGTRAQIPGVAVAGKTGTAQHTGGGNPHAWFIGFAPADAPQYAVAVIVEEGGSLGSEATGGAVAAPVAASVLSAALGR